jgi:hypothetical protein
VSEEVMPEMDLDLVPVPGVATHLPFPEKGMLRRGFLLRQSLGVGLERRRLCSPEFLARPSEVAGTPMSTVDVSVAQGN